MISKISETFCDTEIIKSFLNLQRFSEFSKVFHDFKRFYRIKQLLRFSKNYQKYFVENLKSTNLPHCHN